MEGNLGVWGKIRRRGTGGKEGEIRGGGSCFSTDVAREEKIEMVFTESKK